MRDKTYLTRIQRKRKLSNVKMADKLGISRESWYRIRKGEQEVTGETKWNALIAFPELRDIFLPDNDITSNKSK
jgi:DNA-binding XRE family transcriptional regulator